MSSCSRSTSVLSYLMGELDEDAKALFEKHLESCPACRRELRFERTLQNGLAECTKPDAAPAELRLNVLTKILTMPRLRFPFWQIAVALLSGTTAFLILMKILRGSSLLETGTEVLMNFVEEMFLAVENVSSFQPMILAGIISVGIVSVVASLVPEE